MGSHPHRRIGRQGRSAVSWLRIIPTSDIWDAVPTLRWRLRLVRLRRLRQTSRRTLNCPSRRNLGPRERDLTIRGSAPPEPPSFGASAPAALGTGAPVTTGALTSGPLAQGAAPFGGGPATEDRARSWDPLRPHLFALGQGWKIVGVRVLGKLGRIRLSLQQLLPGSRLQINSVAACLRRATGRSRAIPARLRWLCRYRSPLIATNSRR